jgi:hypothetical protein
MVPFLDQVILMSEHLKCLSFLQLPAKDVGTHLAVWLKRYGPVKYVSLGCLQQALTFLAPIKSFPTRYVVLEWQGGAFLFSDSRADNCNVDAYAVCRLTGARAISITMQETRRALSVFDDQSHLRDVEIDFESDRWYYREDGELQAFEEPTDYLARRKQDRLRPEALSRLFRRYAGFSLPVWSEVSLDSVQGLERSLHEIVNPIHEFKTKVDLSSRQ